MSIASRLRHLTLVLLLAPAAFAQNAAETVNNEEDIPARTVFFELNPSEGATGYELQVRALSQRWAEPMISNLKDTSVRLRLTPGQYEYRTRSFDAKASPGRWAHWRPFWVNFRSPKNVIPPDNAVLEPKASEDERVTFEWPETKRAKSYIFDLYDAQGRSLRHARVFKTWIAQNLKIDSSYTWTITPQNTREGNEPKPDNLPIHPFKIGSPAPLLRGIHVQVDPDKKAEAYEFEFVRFTSKTEVSTPTVFKSKEPFYHVALAPGEYEMRVRSLEPNNRKSAWSSPQRFWVATFAPKQLSPKDDKMLDPTDDLNSETVLKWAPALNAKHYHVTVWDEDAKVVAEKTTDETETTVYLPHEKKYRWSVAAYQDREQEKKPAFDPATTSVFEVNHYKKLDLNSGEEPSQFYAWFRYINSAAQYNAQNYDNNTSINQNLFEGDEEIAAGYWHRKTNIGILAALDVAGLYTEHQEYAWVGGSVLLGYRILDHADRARWRFWAGMALKETPEIMTEFDPAYGVSHLVFRKTRVYAPEVRASYVGEFNQKYGYQLYTKLLKGTGVIKTINDQKLDYLYQANFGVYGTYRFDNGWVGMLGYSYQIDAVAYETLQPDVGGPNSAMMYGHYLSFVLEFGLAKSSR